MVTYPNDWRMIPLIEFCDGKLSYGINAPAIPYSGCFPTYLRITDITENGTYSDKDKKSVNAKDAERYKLLEGDIVLARTGASTGKSYLYNKKDGTLVYAGFLIKASVNNRNNPKYVVSQLKTARYWAWVATESMRSGQPGINGKQYASFLIPQPLKEEQDRIARTLSDFDEYIADLEELIEKKKNIREGAISDLISGRKRLKGFKKDWNKATVGDILTILHGRNQRNVECFNGQYPILGTGGEIGRANAYLCDWECVLIGRKGTIDRPIYMNQPFWTIDTLYYSKPKENQCVKFQYYLFNTIDWYAYTESSGRPSLAKKVIEGIEIIIPEYDEQRAIADALTAMDTEIIELEKEKEKMEGIRAGAMDDLLTGRVRIKA